jgi:hypothetical protein
MNHISKKMEVGNFLVWGGYVLCVWRGAFCISLGAHQQVEMSDISASTAAEAAGLVITTDTATAPPKTVLKKNSTLKVSSPVFVPMASVAAPPEMASFSLNVVHPAAVPHATSPETLAEIGKQLDYYFSNANLWKDFFLQKEISASKEGYVDLVVFLTFNKIKALCNDPTVLAHAVMINTSKKLRLNKARTHIRRNKPLPTFNAKKNMTKTIVVSGFKEFTSAKKIRTIFSRFGKVTSVMPACISIGKASTEIDFKSIQHGSEFKDACVTYDKVAGANNALKTLTDHHLSKMAADGNDNATAEEVAVAEPDPSESATAAAAPSPSPTSSSTSPSPPADAENAPAGPLPSSFDALSAMRKEDYIKLHGSTEPAVARRSRSAWRTLAASDEEDEDPWHGAEKKKKKPKKPEFVLTEVKPLPQSAVSTQRRERANSGARRRFTNSKGKSAAPKARYAKHPSEESLVGFAHFTRSVVCALAAPKAEAAQAESKEE